MNTTLRRLFRTFGSLAIAIGVIASVGYSQELPEGKWNLTGYNFGENRAFLLDKLAADLTVFHDRRIGGSAGCNNYAGSLIVARDGKMKVGPLTSTDRSCDEMRGSFETLFLQTLQNASAFAVEKGQLTITDTGTKTFLRFERLKKQEDGERKIIYVSNKMVKCRGIAPMKCLLTKTERRGAWQNFYDSIIDFDYRPGRFYKIEVERKELGDVPKDSSVYRYKLVRVIRSVKREKDLYS